MVENDFLKFGWHALSLRRACWLSLTPFEDSGTCHPMQKSPKLFYAVFIRLMIRLRAKEHCWPKYCRRRLRF